jgi:hypothetical protein
MKAYKVFKKDGNKLISCMASGKARVIYNYGKKNYAPEWLQEKGYGICCFEDLELAKRFAYGEFYSFEKVVVREIEVDEAKIVRNLPDKSDSRPMEIGELKTYPVSCFSWPMGTIMVPWVVVKKNGFDLYRD